MSLYYKCNFTLDVVVLMLCLLVCMQMFAAISPNLRPLYTGALDNRQHWQDLDDLYRAGSYAEIYFTLIVLIHTKEIYKLVLLL